MRRLSLIVKAMICGDRETGNLMPSIDVYAIARSHSSIILAYVAVDGNIMSCVEVDGYSVLRAIRDSIVGYTN